MSIEKLKRDEVMPAEFPHKKILVPTRVVNVKLEPCDVYIGRTMATARYQDQGWGNPYAHGTRGAENRALAMKLHMELWRRKIAKDPAWLQKMIDELQGKKLGCWCAPAPCHGDNYIQILREAGYE